MVNKTKSGSLLLARAEQSSKQKWLVKKSPLPNFDQVSCSPARPGVPNSRHRGWGLREGTYNRVASVCKFVFMAYPKRSLANKFSNQSVKLKLHGKMSVSTGKW